MPTRKKLLLGNWKMNHTIAEATQFAASIKETKELAKEKGIQIGVCPSFLSLQTMKRKAKGIVIGAQDVSAFDHGAYTGQVSIPMLKEIGVDWAIVGHSERRAYNGETSETCNAKIKALVANEMTAVYCVGESEAVYDKGETNSFVADQITKGLAGLSADDMKKVVIAYEPIWAIGTG
ncbi:MAG TPA: triose-phosphate isomerase, partial [Firmicutes bacterium]|nr:triose-phosphate isomerase [Bacillota bacterium]